MRCIDDPVASNCASTLVVADACAIASPRAAGSASDAVLCALMAVASLPLPVSTFASILDLELYGVPLALSPDGYWVAMALVAVLCSPRLRRPSTASAGSVDAGPG